METIIETKTCKLCNTSFNITDKDIEFLEKISPVFAGKKYQIPTPTLCPQCRTTRRMVWRNERFLYKRKCDFTGKEVISVYSPDKKMRVYNTEDWFSDKWDPLNYGKGFDFSRPFFPQFDELLREVPTFSLLSVNNYASPFVNYSADGKNCHMIYASSRNEDSYYSRWIFSSKYTVDSTNINTSENIYECIDCTNLMNSMFCIKCYDSSDCYGCYDLIGCHNCIGCYNLRNKNYCINNQEFTKEEYLKQKAEIYKNTSPFRELLSHAIQSGVHLFLNNLNAEQCKGDYIINSKNVSGFDVEKTQDSQYVTYALELSDSMDIDYQAFDTSNCYEGLGIEDASKCAFNFGVIKGNSIYYSFMNIGCSNLFGCVGLRNKSYCILNKQYTKEDYEKLVPKIIEHMMKPHPNPLLGGEGILEWGEFFPSNISPFGYNETIAQEYFPLVREEVIGVPVETKDFSSGFSAQSSTPVETRFIASDSVSRGFLHGSIFNWSDYEAPFPKVEKMISADKLPNDISKIPDDILNWAIQCEITKKPFRIIRQELEFYRKHNLPIPHKHPDQRHLERMNLRNPRKLFSRKCDKCGIVMQTTYSPNRPEKVYCEKCYNL